MRRAGIAAITAVTLLASSARADERSACISSAERGQEARDRYALRAAREQFVRCGAADCPDTVRKDCIAWLDDIDRRTPTATFFADTGPGQDITDVRVSIDGVEVASRLTGQSVPVDPGAHTVRFVWRDRQEERTLLFVEGDKNRKVEIRFAHAESADDADGKRSKTVSPWAWVAGGVGVAGLASFGAFGLWGRSDLDTLDGCAPRCDSGDVDAARTKYLIADVSLGVAVVGIGVAAFLFLTAPESPRRDPRAGQLRGPGAIFAFP